MKHGPAMMGQNALDLISFSKSQIFSICALSEGIHSWPENCPSNISTSLLPPYLEVHLQSRERNTQASLF